MNAEPIADDAVALSRVLYIVHRSYEPLCAEGDHYDEAVQVLLLLARDGWVLEPFDQDDE